MKKKVAFAFFLFLVLGIYLILPGIQNYSSTDSNHRERVSEESVVAGGYRRIVSLSPSITETLFALGLGERVVGVTRFCTYPPETAEKVKIGGFIDPNYEAIVTLKPDIVMLLPEHENVRNFITELGLKPLVLHNRRIQEILDTIITIGKVCGVEDSARSLVENIEAELQVIQEKTTDISRPRVLISIGRTLGSGSLKEVYCAGKNTSYDELITCAGGINVIGDDTVAYPVVSRESILRLNPEIIIELVPQPYGSGIEKTGIIKEWETVSDVDAVRDGRVYVLTGDYTVVPGPRFILFLGDLAELLHPEHNADLK